VTGYKVELYSDCSPEGGDVTGTVTDAHGADANGVGANISVEVLLLIIIRFEA